MSEQVRIHKALADAGVASRRKAEQLVIDGRVLVNGERAGVGQLVEPGRDRIEVDRREIDSVQQRVYLVMAKPAGVTSTVSDRHAERTVIDLVPRSVRGEAARLYPVGRLDRDSEGLLLLTNDGDWAQRILHPSHGIEREYAVLAGRALDAGQRRQLERGIKFEEGIASLVGLRGVTGAEVSRLEGLVGRTEPGAVWYRVTLRQGLKRQVRRMFAAVGVPVVRLVRVRFGTITMARMSMGDVRPLTSSERSQLERMAGAADQVERRLVVSIDGPGGSGKSTVGARAAAVLGYRFCDTGLLYRGLTWLAVERGADLDDADALVALVPEMDLGHDAQGRYTRLLVDGREITDELHTAAVDREVSRVSKHAPVREALHPVQRGLAKSGRIIMAGRDIGTVILPDADLKLYLDVSIAERARRRAAERGLADDARAVAQIEDELRQRDRIDSTRETSPLRIPEGATVVETDGLTLNQTVDRVVDIVRTLERGPTDDD